MIITEAEKLYSPLEFYLHNPREEESNGEYGIYDLYDERYKISVYDAAEHMDAIELAIRRDRDRMDKSRGMAEYLDGSLGDKVVSLFPEVENYGTIMVCAAKLTLSEPLTPEEMAELKDWWRGQLSDGWGEGFEQREIKVGREELYVVPWSSGDDFFLDTEREFYARMDIEMPERETVHETSAQALDAPATTAQPLMEVKLYSPVSCTYWSRMDIAHDDPDELTQQGMLESLSKIRDAVLSKRSAREAERGYMHYYDSEDSINEKVKSLFVDIEVHNEQLWAVATIKTAEPLTADEIASLKEYLTDEIYYDELGDQLAHDYIDVDGGEIAVSLWKYKSEYFIDTQAEFALRTGIDYITPSPAEPPLTPAQLALNEPGIFDEDIDCVDTSAYMSMLTDRVNANYIGYIDGLRNMDSESITDYSAELATITEAHYYITNRHNFHFSELDYLLQFKDPLRVVAEAFDANRDEEHSDIMWKIFHEQDALTSNRHPLASDTPDKSETPTAEVLKQELFDRLDKNLSDYRDSMMVNSKRYVYDMAAEIAIKYAACEYMKTGYDYKTGEVEFLLQFQNPLSLIADSWPSTLDGIADITNEVSGILQDRSSHGHYARIMDETNPAAKENAKGQSGAEKQSVIERIRAAEKEPKPTRKDKTVRDKSEPEL